MQSFFDPNIEAKEESSAQVGPVVLAAQLSEVHSLLLSVAVIKVPYLYDDSKDGFSVFMKTRMMEFHCLLGGYGESFNAMVSGILNNADNLMAALMRFDEYTKLFKVSEDYLNTHNYFSSEDPTKNKTLKDAINAHHQLLIDVGPLMDNFKTKGMAYIQNLIRNKTSAFVSEHQLQEVFTPELNSSTSMIYNVHTYRYDIREHVKSLFSMCKSGMKKIISEAHSEVLAFIKNQSLDAANPSSSIAKSSP